MSTNLGLSYKPQDTIKPVWRDFAEGNLYETDVTSVQTNLQSSLALAIKNNLDRKNRPDRKSVLDRILKRGINLTSTQVTSTIDSNDITGLIGEIIAEDFVLKDGVEILFAKWREHGTSKSRGIDLIIRKINNGNHDLILVEAKHSHRFSNAKQTIKQRFEEAIDEFEIEKTLLNLLGITSNMSTTIAKIKAYGENFKELEEKCIFLEKKIYDINYMIQIISCIDNDAFNGIIFKDLMKQIDSDKDIGTPFKLVMELLKIKMLHDFTDSQL